MVEDEIVARLGAIFTSTLSNALEDIGEDGVILGLPSVGPGMRCAGRAMCVAQTTGPAGAFPGTDFKVGAMIDAAGEGDIVVVANNGHCVSSWLAVISRVHDGCALDAFAQALVIVGDGSKNLPARLQLGGLNVHVDRKSGDRRKVIQYILRNPQRLIRILFELRNFTGVAI